MNRPGVPFGVHQALEYLLGAFLALNAVHLAPGAATLALGLGGGLLLLSLVSDGPLGGWRLASPALHRIGDLLVVAVAVASPFVFDLPLEASTLLPSVATTVLMLALVKVTSYSRRPTATGAGAGTGAASATAPAKPPLARTLGVAAAKLQSQGPRALGRAVGRIKRNHDGHDPGSRPTGR